MLVIAVADRDERAISDTVGRTDGILGALPHTVGRFQNYDILTETLEQRLFLPDIAVLTLDASMDGIDAAAKINELAPDCGILFLAEDPSHMTDVYAVRHDSFMLKETMDRYFRTALLRAADKVREKRERAGQESVFIKIHTKMVRFRTDEIVSLERMGRSTVVHTQDGEFVTVEHPLDLVSRISGSRFLRCHQSYWVNTAHIPEGDAKELVTDDGKRIPVSRSYRAALKKLGSGFFHSGLT